MNRHRKNSYKDERTGITVSYYTYKIYTWD